MIKIKLRNHAGEKLNYNINPVALPKPWDRMNLIDRILFIHRKLKHFTKGKPFAVVSH